MNGANRGDGGGTYRLRTHGSGTYGFGTYGPSRAWVPVIALATGVLTLVAAWPGGLGTPRPVEVVQGASAAGYRFIAGMTAGLTWLPPVLDVAAALGLVALGVVVLAVGWAGRGVPYRLAGVVLGLVATVVAYGASEAVKLAVDEERPCRAIDVGMAVVCPPTGDWSFPSNHATCAGALAMALLLIRPRLGLAVGVPLAVAVALARVAEGVHYPHDVLAGLLCGASVTAVLIPVLTPPLARLHTRLRPPARDLQGRGPAARAARPRGDLS